MDSARDPILDVRNVTVAYGKASPAIRDVSLKVEPGEVVAIIGPNGAGKTTLLRAISGIVKPGTGAIEFAGRRIDKLSAHAIAAAGLLHVPEGRHLFSDMSVRENLMVGAYRRGHPRQALRDAERLVGSFPMLHGLMRRKAGRTSGGEQQMTAIARALMGRPKVLMLDEPSTGLAPKIVLSVTETIESIVQDTSVSILLVEQNARMALSVAKRAYVIESGRIVASGLSAELINDRRVAAAYIPTSVPKAAGVAAD